jgi:hypothetical protein
MFRVLLTITTLIGILLSSFISAECCQNAEITVGWRRDSLHWKTDHLHGHCVRGFVNSHILFRDVDLYTLSGKAKWVGSEFYIRFSAEYGLSDKGRAKEHFKLKSPWLEEPIRIATDEPIKRRSEVYDFNLAVGYPFTFFCCRLSVVPLVGFSFHRQHLRVKGHRDPYSYSSCYCGSYDSSCTGSDFSLTSCNPLIFYPYSSSNPFGSPDDLTIASALGLSTCHRTDTYRFTWYGFYLGADIAYALDPCWTLFTELECHFLDNCHRKRKSWTGVYFVDDYHHKGWAYGFNTVFGLTYTFATCWYSTIAIDYKWWKAHSHHDELHWQSVGAKIGLGYMF